MAEIITCSLSLVHSVLSSTRARKAGDLILPLTSLRLKERNLYAWFLFWPMEPWSQRTPSAFLGKWGHLCQITQPSAWAGSVTVQPASQLCWGNNDLKKLTLQLSVVSADGSFLLLTCVGSQVPGTVIPEFSALAGNLKLWRVSRQADQNLRI